MSETPPILDYHRTPRRRVPLSSVIMGSLGAAFYGLIALLALGAAIMIIIEGIAHVRRYGWDQTTRIGFMIPILLWTTYRLCRRVWMEIRSLDPRHRIVIERPVSKAEQTRPK